MLQYRNRMIHIVVVTRILKVLSLSVKSYFSFLISCLNIKIVPEESSLTTALFFIYFARFANSRVDNVSEWLVPHGDIFAIITVLLLPPSESLRMNVSWLLLYGMNWRLFFETARKLITFPSADSDLFIIPASFNY